MFMAAISVIFMTAPCYPQSANEIAGLWHVNKQYDDTIKGLIYSTLSTTKWLIKVSGKMITITKYVEKIKWGETKTSQTELPIRDIDYRNGRLQILTEEIWEEFGITYYKEYFDIRFDTSRQQGQGRWKTETSEGANDPFKIYHEGTIAIRKLSNKQPAKKEGGRFPFEIER